MNVFNRLGQFPLILAIPVFTLLIGLFGIPMFNLLIGSLGWPNLSFESYLAFFMRSANVRVLIQTIEISVVATSICALIGYPASYFITAASRQVRTTLIVLVVIPYLTSILARTYAWLVILGDHGLINTVLLDFGLTSSPLELVYNRLAVYIGMVHIMLPIMMLPIISVMIGLDKSLMSAAHSMGARRMTAFWRVFFPLSMPGLRSGTILTFVLCLGFYITPAALGGLSDIMLSTLIAVKVENTLDMHSISATAFILLAVALILIGLIGVDFSGHQNGPDGDNNRRILSSLVDKSTNFLREKLVRAKGRAWLSELYLPQREAWVGKVLGNAVVALAIIFLGIPGVIVMIMSFNNAPYLEFPPSQFSLRWYASFFGDESWYTAALTSGRIGLGVSMISIVLGTLAAYGIDRTTLRLRSVLTLLILTPITFPVIVVGITVFLGLVNFNLIGTELGLVLAHSIGGVGFVFVIVSATLSNFDRQLEKAANSMGATPIRTFWRITLPFIRPGVIGGAVFAFIHSFDEVVISSLVAGFTVRTLPLKMWENIRHEIDPTIAAVASLLMLLPILWLVALYATWWRARKT